MIRVLDKTSPEFRERLAALAARNGWDADAIGAVMYIETAKTFSPSIRNPSSGATGLIQFMPATALSLGTTTAELARMTAVQQLEYVELYLQRTPIRGRTGLRRVDYYLAVWRPVAVGMPMGAPLVSRGEAAYDQNAVFDADHKGYITPADLDAPMARAYGETVVAKKKAVAAEPSES